MVIHILANGQRVEDIQGRIVTINNKTITAYALLLKGAPNEKNTATAVNHNTHR